MSNVIDVAGRVRLYPGELVPYNLESSRQDWATRMGQGQKAQHLPQIMASLFNLCGQSHRLCSRMAIDVAQGLTLDHPVSHTLSFETVREHVRRIGLDWPRAATPSELTQTLTAQAMTSLQQCPLLKAQESSPNVWEAACDWLTQTCLHMPAHTWLAAWQADPIGWLETWSRQSETWLSRLMVQARLAQGMNMTFMSADALYPHADLTDLRTWALTWHEDPEFVLQPNWHSKPAHTGSWTRLHDVTHPVDYLTPWLLLGYRLADLIGLCLMQASRQNVEQEDGLAYGALQIGERQGLAWVEMARGLLMHQVTLDTNNCVTQVQVLAPTSWNFHAQGVVASVLEKLPADLDTLKSTSGQKVSMGVQELSWLMTAFDPCVPFEVCASKEELCHA